MLKQNLTLALKQDRLEDLPPKEEVLDNVLKQDLALALKQDLLDNLLPRQEQAVKTDAIKTQEKDNDTKNPLMQMGEHIRKTFTQGVFVKTLVQGNDTMTTKEMEETQCHKDPPHADEGNRQGQAEAQQPAQQTT